jgi:hypothetical protein
MIEAAILKLKDRGGSSVADIKKCIMAELNKANSPKALNGQLFNAALKQGLKTGSLVKVKADYKLCFASSYAVMAKAAIAALGSSNGSTVAEIKKRIVAEHASLSFRKTYLEAALKAGEREGTFEKVKANYRLTEQALEEMDAADTTSVGNGLKDVMPDSDSESEEPGDPPRDSPIIEDWILDFDQLVIQGIVFGYQDSDDGLEISTSRVMRAEGKVFYTQSGSRYRLGEVDITFKNSMVEEGIWEEEDSLHHLLESDYKPVHVPPPAVRELLNSRCLPFCPLRHVFHTIGQL